MPNKGGSGPSSRSSSRLANKTPTKTLVESPPKRRRSQSRSCSPARTNKIKKKEKENEQPAELEFGDENLEEEIEAVAKVPTETPPKRRRSQSRSCSAARTNKIKKKEKETEQPAELEFGDENLEEEVEADDSIVKRMQKTKLNDGEPNDIEMKEDEDMFKNESTGCPIDNYFTQGKNVQNNAPKKKNRRKKKDTRGGLDHYEDEEEKAANEEFDPAFNSCDIAQLKDYLAIADQKLPKVVKQRYEKLTEQFADWTFHLAAGFNILVWGVGSKRKLLNEFAEDRGDGVGKYRHLVVDGFRDQCTMKNIFAVIDEKLNLKCPQKRCSLSNWAGRLKKAIQKDKLPLFLIIHSLDGPNMRDPADQDALRILVNDGSVRLVASIDHVNAMLLWNTRQWPDFKFVTVCANTFHVPTEELNAGESQLLGFNPDAVKSAHSASSLDILWNSFHNNSRKIFHLFFKMYYTINEPLQFWDLFNEARGEFLVSSDVALRQLLVELVDHRIMKWQRSAYGNDALVSSLDRKLVEEFLKEKGHSLTAE